MTHHVEAAICRSLQNLMQCSAILVLWAALSAAFSKEVSSMTPELIQRFQIRLGHPQDGPLLSGSANQGICVVAMPGNLSGKHWPL